jgi:hypothetical protein
VKVETQPIRNLFPGLAFPERIPRPSTSSVGCLCVSLALVVVVLVVRFVVLVVALVVLFVRFVDRMVPIVLVISIPVLPPPR